MMRNGWKLSACWLILFMLGLMWGGMEASAESGSWKIVSEPEPGQVIQPRSTAVDGAGSLYVVDYGNNRIQKRDAGGNWTVLATGGSDPGQVNDPTGIAVDGSGNLYVADYGYDSDTYTFNSRVQKRDVQGNWTLLATVGNDTGQVRRPEDVAVDASGNLYVADTDNSRIQKRDVQGNWTVLATSGSSPGQVLSPKGLAVDGTGNLYVTDYGFDSAINAFNSRVQKRDVQGNWTVLATVGTDPGQVYSPGKVAIDTAGSLYVAEGDNRRVQKRDAQGNWSVLVPPGSKLGQIERVNPSGVAIDAVGNLYVADVSNNWIQERDAQGNWTEVAAPSSELGFAYGPSGLAVDGPGNLYTVDLSGSRVQKRDVQGNWTDLATYGFSTGLVENPTGLSIDSSGNIYVADYRNNWIQERDAQGNWTVVVTTGSSPGHVFSPTGIAVDGSGNLYVTDSGNPSNPIDSRVQKRDAQGNWTVLATEGTQPGQVDLAFGIAVDESGNLYVADYGNNRIQKRDIQGNWTVLATLGSGPGQVDSPSGVVVDGSGNLFVADDGISNVNKTGLYTRRIQKRDAQGNWTVLSTQGAEVGFSHYPTGLAVDGSGHLYVADHYNNWIKLYIPASPIPGDLNGDGKVTTADAILALQVVVGILQPSDAQLQAGNLSGSGKITLGDVLKILEFSVGLVSHL